MRLLVHAARQSQLATQAVQKGPLSVRRPPPPPLAEIAQRVRDRDATIKTAYATGAYSYQHIAEYLGIHFTTVGRIVRVRE